MLERPASMWYNRLILMLDTLVAARGRKPRRESLRRRLLVHRIVHSSRRLLGISLSVIAVSIMDPAASDARAAHAHVHVAEPRPGRVRTATRIDAAGQAVVNLANLAEQQAHSGKPKPPVRALMLPQGQEPEEPLSFVSPGG